MHQWVNDVPISMPTVRFFAISNQVCTSMWSVRMNKGIIPFMVTTWQRCLQLQSIDDLMGSFQACGKKIFLVKLGPGPLFSKLGIGNKAFDVKNIETLTQEDLQRNEVTSWGLSSICTLTYCPIRGRLWKFALASSLDFLSLFLAIMWWCHWAYCQCLLSRSASRLRELHPVDVWIEQRLPSYCPLCLVFLSCRCCRRFRMYLFGEWLRGWGGGCVFEEFMERCVVGVDLCFSGDSLH